MPEDNVTLSKKMHTVKTETKDNDVDEREMVLGSARRRRRTCKTNPAGGGFGKNLPTLKLAYQKEANLWIKREIF